ncbi:MurR/RpiR family transcriptional regulator [Aminobacter sp. BA135]|uniref:MurR/RpiR family transcriptional regulator n=1 Tax=Aminobacter sp. BA135 TaxID=537596 RepID=UPI003D7A6138
MLGQIRASLNDMTPAERRAAETILGNPQATIGWSLADAARFSGVSEPSIIRFCRRLGFDGYSDFRLKFAQAVALIRQDDQALAEAADDPVKASILDNCNRAIAAINDLALDIDSAAVARAVDILLKSRRVDIYGHGGSGFLAGEGQHRLAHLGIASVAYSDPALQMFSALALAPGDTIIALSFSGVTTHLMPNLEIARNAGAKIISLTPTGSPIARMADVNIAINAYRQKKGAGFLPSERVSMYVMFDALIGLISAQKGSAAT